MKKLNKLSTGIKKPKNMTIGNSKSTKNFISTLKISIALALFLIAATLISGAGVTVDNGALNVSGNLLVNSNTLFVNSQSNLVGIGTVNPDTLLDLSKSVAGDAEVIKLRNPDAAQNSTATLTFANGQVGSRLAQIRGYVGEAGNNGGGIAFILRDGHNDKMDTDVVFKKTGLEGRVGIGTTAPATRLDVAGVGTFRTIDGSDASVNIYNNQGPNQRQWSIKVPNSNGYFQIVDSNNPANPRLTVDYGGRVGIGTVNPDTLLDLSKSVAGDAEVIKLRNPDAAQNSTATLTFANGQVGSRLAQIRGYVGEAGNNGGGIAFILRDGHNDKMDTDVVFKKTGLEGRVGIGTTAPATRLDVAGVGTFRTIDGSDASVNIYNNQGPNQRQWSIKVPNSNGYFQIVDSNNPANPRLTVDYGGNVGIGTAGPGAPLHVKGSVSDMLKVESTGAGSNIILANSRGQTAEITGGASGFQLNVGLAGDDIRLITQGVATQGIIIKAGGNVGIGTASPLRKLHINDVMRLEPRSSAPSGASVGDLYVDSDTKEICFYDGASWTGLKAGGACA